VKSKKAKPDVSRKSPKNDGARVRDLEKRLAEALRDKAEALKREAVALGQLQPRDRELVEAQAQQAATREVLRVIGSSTSDLQPVFDIIAKRATALTNAVYSAVYLVEDESIHLRAYYSDDIPNTEHFAAAFPMPITSDTLIARTLRTGGLAHIADMEAVGVPAGGRSLSRTLGVRSTLTVPMRRDGRPIGAIGVNRRTPGEFTSAEIALLQTFADQAVIAIENVRLFTQLQASNHDLTTALDQQTATSDILRVISRSQTDVQPVFDAIVNSVVRLLRAYAGALTRIAGEQIEMVALTSTDAAGDAAARASYPVSLQSENPHAQVLRDRAPLNIADAQIDTRVLEAVRAAARARGYRSWVVVPMLHHDEAVGTIGVAREEPGGFTGDEIALLKTFADQAVIAIENVRLFTELEEKNRALTEAHTQVSQALEQQTATSEILRVISSSPTDLAPVFNTILANACRLCDAGLAGLWRYDEGALVGVAHYNGSPEFARWFLTTKIFPGPQGPARKAALERRIVHVTDMTAEPGFSPVVLQYERARTVLAVPLLREGVLVGVMSMWRREIHSFTDQQIELVRTFADQAVIAIENVRLFTELQKKNEALTQAHAQVSESLEQQTATSEILRVISSSPTAVQPVFDAIASNAVRLCNAVNGLVMRFDGQLQHLAAHYNVDPERLAAVREASPRSPSRGSLSGRAILTRAVVHVPDVSEDPEYTRPAATTIGYRSVLAVPMMHEGVALGAIVVARDVVAPFSDAHIALIQTFADQAVIAIENVRLFTELQEKNGALTTAHAQVTESLDQQTATAEILRVISQSPMDVQPVFDAIASSAVRLCESTYGIVHRFDGTNIEQPIAMYNVTAAQMALYRQIFPLAPSMETALGESVLTRRTVHVEESLTERRYTADTQAKRVAREVLGYRSLLVVPMVHRDQALGIIVVWRREQRPFSRKQIALVETFADQAVIAIENVRLFNETKGALERQTASSEILRIISSSPTDLQPVLDAVAERAANLCGASDGSVFRVDGDCLRLIAHHASIPSPPVGQFTMPLIRGTVGGRTVLERRSIHVTDLQQEVEEFPEGSTNARRFGHRTILGVPLLREGVSIGCLMIRRTEAHAFTQKQVELVQAFADQAVIAIENVRLFTELQQKNQALTAAHAQVTESLEQQTATGDILRVISQSPTDIQPVFDAVAESAARLCESLDSAIYRRDGNRLLLVAHHGSIPYGRVGELSIPIVRSMVNGRAVLEGQPVQVADLHTETAEYPEGAEMARQWGHRTMLGVPLMQNGVAIGSITLRRAEVNLFTERQIALLQTFADQAVIAIENVRLFKELEARNRDLTEALDQQTATAEVLKVISRSAFDLQAVLTTLLENATRLCGAEWGVIFRPDSEVHRMAVVYGAPPEFSEFLKRTAIPPGRGSGVGRAALERRTVQVTDVAADPEYELTEFYRIGGFRTVLAVPMLRDGVLLGVFGLHRDEVRPFTEKQIELVTTFADQGVIAIENARLLSELQARTQELTRSVGQLTALGEVGRAVSSTLDLETVLNTIVSRAIQLSGTDGGSVYEYDEATEEFSLRASRDLPEAYVERVRDTRPRKGEGAVGRVAQTREPVQIADISDPAAYESRVRNTLLQIGLRALLAVPLIAEDQLVGALIVMRKRMGTFAAEEVALLQTFATQSALAIQNARLFREIEDKSRQLEVASQHKSEFLANMSHELRTPLNAIIGFSEVLSERMFGDLNEKQEEYSKDIHASGQHLLSLINDILDLSKIEAGRMELELSDFHLPTALDSALTLVRERAGRRGIVLHMNVDSRLGQIQADERKVRQVVLNLLSNAIKFTPEGGRIEVGAVSKDGLVEVSVSDTGVGIAPEDQEAVFEEFRQVGTADKKVEGTGLGLTLCRKFVELHGGKIWVKSELGVGSTFTFSLPLRNA
jgi:GAF domain-containing protein